MTETNRCCHSICLYFWHIVCHSSHFFLSCLSVPHQTTFIFLVSWCGQSKVHHVCVDLLGLHWLRGLVAVLAVWHLNWLMANHMLAYLLANAWWRDRHRHKYLLRGCSGMREAAYWLDPYRTRVLPSPRLERSGWWRLLERRTCGRWGRVCVHLGVKKVKSSGDGNLQDRTPLTYKGWPDYLYWADRYIYMGPQLCFAHTHTHKRTRMMHISPGAHICQHLLHCRMEILHRCVFIWGMGRWLLPQAH